MTMKKDSNGLKMVLQNSIWKSFSKITKTMRATIHCLKNDDKAQCKRLDLWPQNWPLKDA